VKVFSRNAQSLADRSIEMLIILVGEDHESDLLCDVHLDSKRVRARFEAVVDGDDELNLLPAVFRVAQEVDRQVYKLPDIRMTIRCPKDCEIVLPKHVRLLSQKPIEDAKGKQYRFDFHSLKERFRNKFKFTVLIPPGTKEIKKAAYRSSQF